MHAVVSGLYVGRALMLVGLLALGLLLAKVWERDAESFFYQWRLRPHVSKFLCRRGLLVDPDVAAHCDIHKRFLPFLWGYTCSLHLVGMS